MRIDSMKRFTLSLAVALAASLALANTAVAANEPDQLVSKAEAAFRDFQNDPNMQWLRDNLGRAKAVMIAPEMRKAAFVVGGPAAAEWKEFNSVSEGFGVVFPADPDIEEIAKFEVVPGKMVPAHIYSTRYDNSLFKMTVVDGRDAGLQETAVVDQALKKLTQGGEVKINFPTASTGFMAGS